MEVRPGAGLLDGTALAALGLSSREIQEFGEKLRPRDRPDFELDLTRMRSAESIAAEMERAVPVEE